ncbi:hypothetical protein [Gymnodinialimonas ulvae]|uniref:hypothetical protein n=1 Tax=Gymnodinialimonas ulvae TaxID=3126504 RepID=UPI003099DA82
MGIKDLSLLSKIAIGLAIAGFVLSVQSTSTVTENGVTTCSFIDYAKLVLGGLAVLVGGMGEFGAIRDAATRNVNLIASGGASMAGLVLILLGLGVIGGPC